MIPVLTSKKGTRVVRASDLYRVLALPTHHYLSTLRKWMRGTYEFHDGIRRPLLLKDFAVRPKRGADRQPDFFLTLSLARQVAVRTGNRHGLACGNFLRLQQASAQIGTVSIP